MSLTVSELAETFGKDNTDITWGITLVLMFRSVGSILFGIAADRYGRKWPFIVNNVLFIVLELVSHGLTKLFHPPCTCQLACRSRHLAMLVSLPRHAMPALPRSWPASSRDTHRMFGVRDLS